MRKETIWYAGVKCSFVQEVPDTPKALDELQAVLDWMNKWGRKACALHENGKHQLYKEVLTESAKEDRKERYLSQ